jgi:hypothetical protein
MIHPTKNTINQQILNLKKSILQFPELAFADILSTELLLGIVNASSSCRNRIYTPLVTLKTFIFQVLSADGSCRQAVGHVLSERLRQGQAASSAGQSHLKTLEI